MTTYEQTIILALLESIDKRLANIERIGERLLDKPTRLTADDLHALRNHYHD